MDGFTITRANSTLLLVAVLGGLWRNGARDAFVLQVRRRASVGLELDGLVLRYLIPGCRRRPHHVHRSPRRFCRPVDRGREYLGIAAIAVLVGLFSAQATTKLKDIFETILTPANKGGNPIKGAPAAKVPTIVSFDPPSGPEATRVELSGTGLEAVTSVMFGGGIEEPAAWYVQTKRLVTKVPPGAADGPLRVTVDGTEVATSVDFTVT